MRDTCQPFRKAIYDALSGNVTYNSVQVPVYDEKTFVTNTASVFILLSTQQEIGINDNDCAWVTLSSIDVEIVSKTASEVTKNAIDTISGTVMGIILPTRTTTGITQPSGFQVVNFERTSTLTQTVSLSPTESILIKIIKFSATFVELM